MKWTVTISGILLAGFTQQGQNGWKELEPINEKRVRDAYFTLISTAKTIHIVELATHVGETIRMEDWLMKPFARTAIEEPTGQGARRKALSYMLKDRTYDVRPVEKSYDIFPRWPGSPFINGLEPYLAAKRPSYTMSGKVFQGSFDGKPAYRIQTGPQSIPGSMVSVFVKVSSLIPMGWEYAVNGKGSEIFRYQVFELNGPMNLKDFEWMPPAGYKLKSDWRKHG